MKIPLNWPKGAARACNAALLYAVELQALAVITARARFENSPDRFARLTAENDRLRHALAAEREVRHLVTARINRMPSHQRSHYTPQERHRILVLKAKHGWTVVDTARRLLVSPATINGWKRRFDEVGSEKFIAARHPVNRHSDRTAYLVKDAHAHMPQSGRRRVADTLARAGFKLAASTVRRMLLRKLPPRETPPEQQKQAEPTPTPPAPTKTPPRPPQRVKARAANHVWHVDFTLCRNASLFPDFAPLSLWPFCWHILLVVDHFTRRIVAFEVFKKEPTAKQLCRVLECAVVDAGTSPGHIVSDRGAQFMSPAYADWCRRHKTRQRFGAIGKHGSIAVVERCNRTLKHEHLRQLDATACRQRIVDDIADYVRWYNEQRPHAALAGRTPHEALNATPHPLTVRRFEPRERMPIDDEDKTVVRADLELEVTSENGHRHLPIITLRAAA